MRGRTNEPIESPPVTSEILSKCQRKDCRYLPPFDHKIVCQIIVALPPAPSQITHDRQNDNNMMTMH